MIKYRNAIIFRSFDHWTAVFGYGDYVQKKTLGAVKRAVDIRRDA